MNLLFKVREFVWVIVSEIEVGYILSRSFESRGEVRAWYERPDDRGDYDD